MAIETTLQQIRLEVRALSPASIALTIAMLPFFLAGFVVFHLARVGWLGFAFCWSAAVVGYRRASGASRGVDGWTGGRKIRDA